MTNRRGCYRTTEGRSLLQRDPDGHRREAGAAARNCHWAGLALDLDRNEPSAGDLAINQAERYTTSPWTVYSILLGLPLMPQ